MRTRRYANTERLRAKERRLLEVLRRKEAALTYSMFPAGIVRHSLTVSAPIGGTTVTIQPPLAVLAPTAGEVWQVDFEEVPDSTGGFEDVTIPSAKQIAELAAPVVLSLTGRSVGEHIVYAQHVGVEENPEERFPPPMYAGGTGVYEEHRDFFGHAHPDGQPIPREAYDATLQSEVVSEYADRLTIAVADAGSMPSNGVPLMRITWDGTNIVEAVNIGLTVRVDDVRDGGVTAPKIAAGAVTNSKLGERSVTTEKIALSGVQTENIAPVAVTGPKIANEAINAQRLAEGAVTGPKIYPSAVSTTHLANHAVTDAKIADETIRRVKARWLRWMPNNLFFAAARVYGDGSLQHDYLPPGFTVTRTSTGTYRVQWPPSFIVVIISPFSASQDPVFSEISVEARYVSNTERRVTVSKQTSGSSTLTLIDDMWAMWLMGYETSET